MLRIELQNLGTGVGARLHGQGAQDGAFRVIEPPLSSTEREDIRWYVEDFMRLPVEGYVVRAKRVEGLLQRAGSRLFESVFQGRREGQLLERLLEEPPDQRWLEVALQAGASPEPLSWPWELIRDERGFLATRRLRVRRTMPWAGVEPRRPSVRSQLRALVLVARPDDQSLASPHATVDAMIRATTDSPVHIDVCARGTIKALGDALRTAIEDGWPYDVVHINAHGDYSPRDGAKLALEREPDGDGEVSTDYVTATEIGERLHDKGVDLVILEACRSSMTDSEGPVAHGFAHELLGCGLGAVVAMGYTVHVDATRPLFETFYEKVGRGGSVGEALTLARERMSEVRGRRAGFDLGDGQPEIELHDWFVPQLFQRGHDFTLVRGEPVARGKPPALPRSTRDGAMLGAFPLAPEYGFLGRVSERYRVERALAYSAAVLIHGLAGMGKTMLACEVAAWLLRIRRADLACFVDFRNIVSEGHALSVMGTALVGPQGADRGAVVKTFRTRRVLVVWDNIETLSDPRHAKESAALGALAADLTEDDGGGPVRGRLLLTSKDPGAIAPGAWRVGLDGLRPNDARDLLARVLRRLNPPIRFRDVIAREGEAAGVSGNEQVTRSGVRAVDELLAFLGHHPLSISLVGPGLEKETCSEIRGGLEAQKETSPSRSLPEDDRAASLRSALAWSVERLDHRARDALIWLTLFSGGVFEHTLVQVSEMAPPDWAATCEVLQRTGLVAIDRSLPDRPYLVLHPSLGLVATGDREDLPTVRRRFANAYGDVARDINKRLAEGAESFRVALEIYRREEANLVRAIPWSNARDWSAMQGAAHASLRALGREREVGRLLEGRAPEVDHFWADSIEQASALAKVDPETAIKKLRGLAQMLGDRPDDDPATVLVDQTLGRELLEQGRTQEAEGPLATAVRRLRVQLRVTGPEWEKQLRLSLAAALSDISVVHARLGRFDDAESSIRESAAISEALGDTRSVAISHDRVANLRSRQGRLGEERDELAKAVELAKSVGDVALEANLARRLGIAQQHLNDFAAANAAYQRALELFLKSGEQLEAMSVRNDLGTLHQELGDFEASRTWYEGALRDAEELGATVEGASTLDNLANLAMGQGMALEAAGKHAGAKVKYEDAERLLLRSRAIQEGLGVDASWNLHALGVSQLRQGRLGEAYESLLRCHAIQDRSGEPEIYKCRLVLAEVCLALGRKEESAAWRSRGERSAADAEFRAFRPGYLQAIAALAKAARSGRMDPLALAIRSKLAQSVGWAPELGTFFDAAFAGAVDRSALPPDLPKELADVVVRVLDGEEPKEVLSAHVDAADLAHGSMEIPLPDVTSAFDSALAPQERSSGSHRRPTLAIVGATLGLAAILFGMWRIFSPGGWSGGAVVLGVGAGFLVFARRSSRRTMRLDHDRPSEAPSVPIQSKNLLFALTSATIGAALERDGASISDVSRSARAVLAPPVRDYLDAVAAGERPTVKVELPEPFDQVFRDLFERRVPTHVVALQLMALVVDAGIAALCHAAVLARQGAPAPGLLEALDRLASAPDEKYAGFGRYLRELTEAGSFPELPPKLLEPTTTLLAALRTA